MPRTRRPSAHRPRPRLTAADHRDARVLDALGVTPDEHLAWLVDWTLRPYDHPLDVTGRGWEGVLDDYAALSWILRRSHVLGLSAPPLRHDSRPARRRWDLRPLVAAQSALFDFFGFAAGLADTQTYELRVQVRSGFLRTDTRPRLRRTTSGPLPAQIIEATWDLLTRVRDGFERIRVCELTTCRRLFLAERRTRLYCSRAHASLASVHAYRKRERKGVRRRATR